MLVPPGANAEFAETYHGQLIEKWKTHMDGKEHVGQYVSPRSVKNS